MNVIPCELEGLLVVEPKVFGDPRGYFFEQWSESRYGEHRIGPRFVQDNVSFSRKGILRGLHAQNPKPQGKLVSVLMGEVFDVAVDLRRNSKTFGRWHGVILSSENKRQFYIPPGFAHGFVVTSETAIFHYKCTDYYSPAHELTVRWDDPDIAVRWPVTDPQLSTKDAAGVFLRDIPPARLY